MHRRIRATFVCEGDVFVVLRCLSEVPLLLANELSFYRKSFPCPLPCVRRLCCFALFVRSPSFNRKSFPWPSPCVRRRVSFSPEIEGRTNFRFTEKAFPDLCLVCAVFVVLRCLSEVPLLPEKAFPGLCLVCAIACPSRRR